MSRSFLVPLMLCVALAGLACAKRPVLYPNGYYETVGASAAESDVDQCMEEADHADLKSSKAADAAVRTGGGAAVGAATGAVAGAIRGGAGTGAAIGAATGATVGFFSWIFGSSEPDPLYVRYVDICLSEKGYRSVGWK